MTYRYDSRDNPPIAEQLVRTNSSDQARFITADDVTNVTV